LKTRGGCSFSSTKTGDQKAFDVALLHHRTRDDDRRIESRKLKRI
jgi:hypothetical protein